MWVIFIYPPDTDAVSTHVLVPRPLENFRCSAINRYMLGDLGIHEAACCYFLSAYPV